MKYIKLYEEIDQSFIYQVSQFINWKMISDIKDMSLEYIDEGYTLHIFVFYTMNNGISAKTMRLTFNHKQSDIDWGIHRDIEKKENIYYKVRLISKKAGNFILNNEKTIELVDRIKGAYPNEKVGARVLTNCFLEK